MRSDIDAFWGPFTANRPLETAPLIIVSAGGLKLCNLRNRTSHPYDQRHHSAAAPLITDKPEINRLRLSRRLPKTLTRARRTE